MKEYNMDMVFGVEQRKAYMGIAILWIIGYHFYLTQAEFIDDSFYPLRVLKYLFSKGYIGVDIFFILSSFGLCHSWENNKLWVFYKRRFLKIIPLYVVFLVLLKIILYPEGMWAFLHDSVLQITSLSVFNTQYTRTFHMSGEWFVPAIINLYVIFPLLFCSIKKILSKYKNGGGIIVGGCVLASLLLFRYISPLYMFRFPIIVMGILTYLYLKKKDNIQLFGIYVLFASFSFFIERNVLMLSVVVPIVLKGLNDINLKINSRFLSYVGSMSFELYLAHIIPMNFLYGKSIIMAAFIMVGGTVVLVYFYKTINSLIHHIK